MVSGALVGAGAAAFILLFVGSMLWLTWLSLRNDQHSPPTERDDAAE